jgi:hypothetical protein
MVTNQALAPSKGASQSLCLLISLSSLYFLLEFVPNVIDGYGYFIDELYYIACSKRLAFGYVDHPPVSVWMLAAWSKVFGSSTVAIRFLPAFFGGATVFMTGWIARRLGAGLFGQGLAAVAYMAAAVPMVIFGMYSMNAFQLLLWTAIFYLLIEIGDGGDKRLWIVFGVLAGIGLMNKHTLVLMSVGLTVGLILTPARKFLLERRLWIGAVIAGLILVPNILWQIQNGWPSLEFYRNAALLKNLPASPLEIVMHQILYMNPAGVLVWLPGLAFLLFSARAKQWRFIAWIFVALLAILMYSGQSRPDRITSLYPILFAAGGLFWESLSLRRGWAWIRWVLVVPLIVSGLLLMPLGIPVLSPEKATNYSMWLGMVPQMERGEGKKTELPQWFADRFGWEELVRDVAAVYETIPEEERAGTVILAPSYGHAGAIELFGPQYDLPPVAGTQNSYHLWGLPNRTIQTVISLDFGPNRLSSLFESVEEAGFYECDYCMRWRDEMRIYIARDPEVDFREHWEDFRNFE